MNRFLAAAQFLTSIPLPGQRQIPAEDVGRSTVYFPVVGLVIGLVLAALNWILRLVLPSAVVNALLLAFLVMVTGALHLDGFADTCDGIAGHKSVEERWQVMRDSRVGAFGVIGIVLLLLAKYASLNSLSVSLIVPALIFMPVVSRWAMTYAIFAYPYARPSGLGTVFKQGASRPGLIMATVITLAVALALLPLWQLTGLAVMFGVWLITMLLAAYLKRKFSGLTGDNYGAINEVAEAGSLIIVTMLGRLGLPWLW